MSIHDEQEIERLRAQAESMRERIRELKYQLGTAMMLLGTARCDKPDMLSCEIWRNRKKQLEAEYNV